jgi:hypothetical protein
LDALVLISLGSLAVAQPLLSDFREGAGYFVARRVEPLELVLLVLVLTLAPGLLANLMVWGAAAFSETARVITHTAFVGVFAALIVEIALVRFISINWVVVVLVSVAIGAAICVAYFRGGRIRTFAVYLIPAPLVFSLFFLLVPPVSGLVFPREPTTIEANVESDAPVVFIVLDEFPVASLLNANEGIDAARYPNFARLASISTWYKYTAAAHDFTWWAVPSLLSGEAPDTSLLPNAASYPGNLFTLLDRSYDLHVMEPFTQLCTADLCGESTPTSSRDRITSLIAESGQLFASLLEIGDVAAETDEERLRRFEEGNANRIEAEFAADQLDRWGDFVAEISPADSTLYFAHLLVPHAPFYYYPSGLRYNGGGDLEGLESDVWVDRVLANQAYQRHLLQAQAVDGMIGDLLTKLESVGVLDESVIVVTADHGVSFKPDTPRREVTASNAYEIGLVPLFIKAPHQARGLIDSIPARSIDVLPTVADLLGLDLPWSHEGRSLREEPVEPSRLTVLARAGSEVELDNPIRGLQRAIAHLESVFSRDGGVVDPFSIGPYQGLIGKPARQLTRSTTLTASLEEPWRLAHVAPYMGFVPGLIRGHLSGEIVEGLHIAVWMNGAIRTIVPVYDVEGESAQFSAVIPDSAFVAGFNDIDLLAVSGAVDAPTMELVELEHDVSYRLEKTEAGRLTRLLDSEGGSWPVQEKSPVMGFVDGAAWHPSDYQNASPSDLYLHGWAVNEGTMAPADQVVFFVGDVYAGSVDVEEERPANVELYSDRGVLESGFIGKVAQFLPSDDLEVRAFALSGGRAHELEVTELARLGIASG